MAVEMKSYPLNNTLYEAEDAQLYTATRTNGIYSSDEDFIVTAVTDQPLRLVVSPGLGWIRYSRFGGMVVASKENTALSLEVAPALFKRIDRVVIRYNMISNVVELAVKSGTATSNPAAPALQRDTSAYELGIADVTVSPGQTTLRTADILDTRLSEALCGLMSDGVTRLPTQPLYEAWASWYENLRADTDEKIKILDDWIETFRDKIGDDFEEWFANFKKGKEEEYRIWIDGIGHQLGTEVGSALFAFGIVNRRLRLYYDNDLYAKRFKVVNRHLIYEFNEDDPGTEFTSLLRMKERMDKLENRLQEIEGRKILNLNPVIGGES